MKTCTVTNNGNISFDVSGGNELAPSKDVEVAASSKPTTFSVRGTVVATVFNNLLDSTVTTIAGTRIPGAGPITVTMVMKDGAN